MSQKFWRVNAPDVISETIDGETIILHLGNGFYFSVGGCGPQAWQMLSTSTAVDEVVGALSAAHDTADVDVQAEVARFVEELAAEGLLVPTDEGAANREAPEMRGGRFEAPTLSKFTDMEDLLLLDPVHEVSPQQGWPFAAGSSAE